MSETLDGGMAPVAAGERIDVIDILRGMTLFGILMANMRGFNAPSLVYFNIGRMFSGRADSIVTGLMEGFVQGKCVTLFALLFGLGFAVQMDRAAERGRSVSFYPRRLAILLVIGLIHGLAIWWGDILVPYALMGFVLLLFRNKSQKAVAFWALLLFSSEYLITIGFGIWGHFHPSAPAPPGPAGMTREIVHAISVYRDGSLWGIAQYKVLDWFQINWPAWWVITFVLPRFLAGLWLWRTGLLKNVEAYLPLIRKVCGWSLAIGLTCDAAMAYFAFVAKPPRGVFTLPGLLNQVAHGVSIPALSCFYACAVLLLVQKVEWKRRLAPFGAVGRMALTNYLLQSVILTSFFHWTKLYGKVGPAMGLIPTVVLFALQIPFSVWWLQHHEFGPMEWLWRSLTYSRVQPNRKRLPQLSAVAG
ncbi:MAG: DUF418 domain-containing protein [Bryobacteraceae bacterium]